MIIIGNGKLVTRDSKQVYRENNGILLENERILKIGPEKELLEQYPDATYLDAEGMMVMPGYINAHTHIYSAFARGLIMAGRPATNFLEILDRTWWHIDRNLTLQNTYYSALATYIECIKNGVTFVSDHHAGYGSIRESLFEIAKAAKQLSVRTCLSYEISDRDGTKKTDAAITENMEFAQYVKQMQATGDQQSKMLHALIGLHASFTLSDETLEKCRNANVLDTGYHIHIAEGQYDAEHCMEHYGMTIVERLQKEKILGEKTLAGHCIHITKQDMDILKHTKTAVIHNPESNMSNAVGAPDVIALLEKDIVTGLGTDGYTNDMLESLKVANLLQKHRRGLPDKGMQEAVTMLFQNNASIVNHMLEDQLGILKEGALADIIFVKYCPYTPIQENNIDGHLMFGVTGTMTDTTIINGKIVMRHRELIEVDEEEILAKCKESAKELWKTL